MYEVVTGTNEYGNSDGCITYNDIPMNEIADDLMKYRHWDYANVYGDFGTLKATIYKVGVKTIIDYPWDEIC